MENKRFEITETAGSVKGFYVVVDKETGVNYLVAKFGAGAGICPKCQNISRWHGRRWICFGAAGHQPAGRQRF